MGFVAMHRAPAARREAPAPSGDIVGVFERDAHREGLGGEGGIGPKEIDPEGLVTFVANVRSLRS